MTIILFELFSRTDPFPGKIGQIFEAKRLDRKPSVPSNFSSVLKELIHSGWSKEPKERPPIQEFKSVLMTVLTEVEKKEFNQTSEKTNSLKSISSKQREAELETQDKCNKMLQSGKSKAPEVVQTDEATKMLANREMGKLNEYLFFID